MLTPKAELLERLRADLRTRLERLTKAAREAHAAATDAGSKAESKYDTRNLEASYLARGQARQVEELADALRIFENLVLPEFDITSEVEAGALVEVDIEGQCAYYLLAPAGGGMTLEFLDAEVTVLTPESPLYGKLLGLHTGDTVAEPPLTLTEVM